MDIGADPSVSCSDFMRRLGRQRGGSEAGELKRRGFVIFMTEPKYTEYILGSQANLRPK